MSTIGSGHFEALYGGQEGSKVQRSNDIFQQIATNSYSQSTPKPVMGLVPLCRRIPRAGAI